MLRLVSPTAVPTVAAWDQMGNAIVTKSVMALVTVVMTLVKFVILQVSGYQYSCLVTV